MANFEAVIFYCFRQWFFLVCFWMHLPALRCIVLHAFARPCGFVQFNAKELI